MIQFKKNPLFTEMEKALLSYPEEVTLAKTATDNTFEDLKRYFNDTEIVEISWVNATENYHNILAKPLELNSDNLKGSA